MLQKESVSKYLLKPNKYMIMTVQTFKNICGTIKELTQKSAFLKRLSKQKEITDLVFSRNRSLNQKIEFRYGKICLYLSKCVTIFYISIVVLDKRKPHYRNEFLFFLILSMCKRRQILSDDIQFSRISSETR